MQPESKTTKSAIDIIDTALKEHFKAYIGSADTTSLALSVFHALRRANLLKGGERHDN